MRKGFYNETRYLGKDSLHIRGLTEVLKTLAGNPRAVVQILPDDIVVMRVEWYNKLMEKQNDRN